MLSKPTLLTLITLLTALLALLLSSSLSTQPSPSPSPSSTPSIVLRSQIPCPASYPGCRPHTCGRLAIDNIVSPAEADILSSLLTAALNTTGGGSGGVSVLDLASGAVSRGSAFVDLYKVLSSSSSSGLSREALDLYRDVVNRVKGVVAATFEAKRKPKRKLFLSSPTFFSQFEGGVEPSTEHDEYWHTHIDTNVYPHFSYTGLVYLTDPDHDFQGGSFQFESGEPIEARKGRVLVFSSGPENPHHVEPVSSGIRRALTISFSCDPTHSIESDFLSKALQQS